MPKLTLSNNLIINKDNIEHRYSPFYDGTYNLRTITNPGYFCKRPLGWYKCEFGTFTDGSVSFPESTGDYTVFNTAINSAGYGCILVFSPRWNTKFYYGQIWQSRK